MLQSEAENHKKRLFIRALERNDFILKKRKLGNTTLSISEIGMGLEHLLDKDEQVIYETIRAAVKGGITYFDCHPGHDYSKVSIEYEGYVKLGKAIQGIRNKINITYLAPTSLSPEDTDNRFKYYLQALNTDNTDVFIIQFCDKIKDYDLVTGEDGLLSYSQKLKAEGKTKYIGISTHSMEIALRAIHSGSFDVLMFPVNPAFDVLTDGEQYDTEKLDSLWDAAYDFDSIEKKGWQPRRNVYSECERMGVGLIAMKPFAGGFIFNVEKNAGFNPINLLSYALAQNGVSSVIPGCTNSQEVEGILAYNTSSEDEKSYSVVVSKSRWSVMSNCIYCNHCLPCKVGINIAQVNRYLDAYNYCIKLDENNVQNKYGILNVKASACIQCGECMGKCPFKVDVISRMKQAVTTFE